MVGRASMSPGKQAQQAQQAPSPAGKQEVGKQEAGKVPSPDAKQVQQQQPQPVGSREGGKQGGWEAGRVGSREGLASHP